MVSMRRFFRALKANAKMLEQYYAGFSLIKTYAERRPKSSCASTILIRVNMKNPALKSLEETEKMTRPDQISTFDQKSGPVKTLLA